MDLTNILICISVGFFIVEFEPIHYVLDSIKEKAKNKVVDFFVEMFSCWKCMTFWSSIVITQDFYTACVATVGAVLIERWIEK